MNADLSVPGHPSIFALGDIVTSPAPDGTPVPGIGDGAKQGGGTRRRSSRRGYAGTPPRMPFRYRHLGDIATIGRSRALIDFGFLRLTGWIGWWAWGLAHIYFLIGLKNRIFIALNWLWISITGYRSARLITQDMPGSASQAGDATPADAGGPQSEPASASLRA